MWFERKKNAELKEQLEKMQPVILTVVNGELKWFGHIEFKDDIDWAKYCTVLDGFRQTVHVRKTWLNGVKFDN